MNRRRIHDIYTYIAGVVAGCPTARLLLGTTMLLATVVATQARVQRTPIDQREGSTAVHTERADSTIRTGQQRTSTPQRRTPLHRTGDTATVRAERPAAWMTDSMLPADSKPLPGLPLVSTSARPLPPGVERIFIEHVDLWSYDKETNADAQILTGNVVFKHKDAYMYCDSALLYRETNRFEAYGRVQINQGDSIYGYSDYLDYDGMTMMAQMRDYVRLEQGENTLYTDNLDYDRQKGLAYYFDRGSIVDSLNTLTSNYGEYNTVTKTAVFNDDVVLQNDQFTLQSDTLHYDTNTKVATILGPTTILNDSGRIEATRGTYDTERDRATLLDRAEVFSGDKWMTGDSLIYDRPAKLAKLYGDVVLRDTAQKAELHGGYVEYHEDTEYGIARERAYVMESSSQDTLYAHALLLEITKTDSTANLIRGQGNVRLYRRDVQATSDSLVYHTGDSILHCIGHPYIWSGKSQVTGDTITFNIANGTVRDAYIRENAFIAQEVQGKYFDQMRGREVMAYFDGEQMDSLRVRGNAETIYYSLNPDSVLLEQVRSQSSEILMEYLEQELDRIVLYEKTTGVLTPVLLLTEDQYVYPTFVWFPEGRPTSFEDIFRTTPVPGSSAVNQMVAKPAEGSFFADPIEEKAQSSPDTGSSPDSPADVPDVALPPEETPTGQL